MQLQTLTPEWKQTPRIIETPSGNCRSGAHTTCSTKIESQALTFVCNCPCHTRIGGVANDPAKAIALGVSR